MARREVKDTEYKSPCIKFTTSNVDVLLASNSPYDLYSDDYGNWTPEEELS